MMGNEVFDVAAFRLYSNRHKALSWWALTLLAAAPLLLYLGGQPEIALLGVMLFAAFMVLDPVARRLFFKVPVARDRLLSSIGLYVLVGILSNVHGGLAAVTILFGVATIGLLFSRRSKLVWDRLIEVENSREAEPSSKR